MCRARQEEILYIVGPANRKSHSSLVLKAQDGYGEENLNFFFIIRMQFNLTHDSFHFFFPFLSFFSFFLDRRQLLCLKRK